MKKAMQNQKRIVSPRPALLLLAGFLLVLVKLFLAGAQNVLLSPEAAGLDDMMMYNGAVAIVNGEWLGEYGWMTLSKHSFFSLWLAALHLLGIPFLLGGQLLWVGAAAAGAGAFAPVLKQSWQKLALFAVLLYNPASTANPLPDGFTLRVYRDNIFPALCLLCVAGMVGFALRHRQKLRRSVWWLALSGAAFAAAWLCREDGWWLLPFVLAAALVTAVFVLRQKGAAVRAKIARCAALLLPFLLVAAGVLGWCAANNAAYGRFIVSDFSGGEFADAYGAMTRIEHESWDPKIGVPRDVRDKLYADVPAFAELKPLLEGENYLDRYAGKRADGTFNDYDSGSFYWALREAAAERGYYATPQKAEAYFTQLAADINALCDEGVYPATPPRSSVSPPIKAAYIGPVLAEGFYSLWFCATFRQCDPRSIFSYGGNDPVFYPEVLQPMEEFLHEKALTATLAGSDAPYYSLRQKACFAVLDGIRVLYAAATPLAFLAALCWQVAAAVRHLRRRAALPGNADGGKAGALKTDALKTEDDLLLWLVLLGLLFCILLRAFMVAFVTVSSFHIGTYIMYLASIHPMLLLYACIGGGAFVRLVRRRGAKRDWADEAKTGQSGSRKAG